MSSSQNKMTKNLSNYGAFVSGWWVETDAFVIEKRENLVKENFLIELYFIVMRKGWWQENSWLMGWENFVWWLGGCRFRYFEGSFNRKWKF